VNLAIGPLPAGFRMAANSVCGWRDRRRLL